jgi:large subunit ribosomal protein L29
MKAQELKSKRPAELRELLNMLHRERFNLKMQKATGQLSKPDQIGRIRKDIARINTVLTAIGEAK